jgi:hypothetical protein
LIEAGEIDVALGRFKKVLEDEDVVWVIVESLDEDFAESLREEDEETNEEDDVKDEKADVKDDKDDVKDEEDKVKDEKEPKDV